MSLRRNGNVAANGNRRFGRKGSTRRGSVRRDRLQRGNVARMKRNCGRPAGTFRLRSPTRDKNDRSQKTAPFFGVFQVGRSEDVGLGDADFVAERGVHRDEFDGLDERRAAGNVCFLLVSAAELCVYGAHYVP